MFTYTGSRDILSLFPICRRFLAQTILIRLVYMKNTYLELFPVSEQIFMLISIFTCVSIPVCLQRYYYHACKIRSRFCRLWKICIFSTYFSACWNTPYALWPPRKPWIYTICKSKVEYIYIYSIFGFKNLFCTFFPTV